MTPGEVNDTLRNNFVEKAKEYFEFLNSELHFEGPNHRFYEQANGSITRDELRYENQHSILVIINAYHPVYYGFEINLTDKLTVRTKMLYHVLKEEQDIEQSYLKKVVEDFRKKNLQI